MKRARWSVRWAAPTLALALAHCGGGGGGGSPGVPSVRASGNPAPTASPVPGSTASGSPALTPPANPSATPRGTMQPIATPGPTAQPSTTPRPTAQPTATPISTGSTRRFPDTTNGIFVFSDQIDTSSSSEAQMQFAATHYAGAQKLLPAVAAHLRGYNSNFLVLHYRLGEALGYRAPVNCQPAGGYISIIDGNWVQEWPGDANVTESWFFHYNGSRVYNCAFGWYLMELNDPSWRSWWSGKVIEQLSANADDGVFADSFSVPNYFDPYNPNLPVVDSAFEASWAQRMHSFTDYMRAQFAGRWLWIPNVGSWITTRDPSDYSNVDGAMLEGFAEGGGGNYYALGDWQLQMNRALTLVNADKIVIGQTYPNGSDVAERLFDLGTYLLIKGRHTYVNLDALGLTIQWLPEYGVVLGAPLDPVPSTISGLWNPAWNVYVRRYASGLVLVNPAASTSGTINLGGTFYTVTPSGGGAVPADGSAPGSLSYSAATSLNLCAHCAAVLLNQHP